MLSIVIPAYAQSEALSRTLRSLARQTAPSDDFEVVIADDASPEPIDEDVTNDYPNFEVRVVRHPENRGRSAARNTAAAAARGEYLLLLDSDSVAHSNLVRAHLDRHASGDCLVLGRRIEPNWSIAQRIADGAPLPLEVGAEQDDVRYRYGIEEAALLHASPWEFTVSHNLSLPRRTYEALGGFDENFRSWGYEDTEFGYRVYTHWQRDGRRFRFAPEAAVYHVPHFLNSVENWAGAADGLQYLKRKHQHFEVERLGGGRAIRTQPLYAEYLLRPNGGSGSVLKDLEDALPFSNNRLWAGRFGEQLSSAPAATLDCTQPRSPMNRPLIGIHTPFGDDSFGDAVYWDNWRILTIGDLSALIVEGLRLAPTIYLAGTRELRHPAPLAQASDLGCILENSLLDVHTLAGPPTVFVAEIRRR